ncbi:MAG: hypothetical protein ACI89L_001032 [Phycisphaerales bacterium]|jgi:hypothetical protein
MSLAVLIVLVVLGYLTLGVLVAFPIMLFGVRRIDPAASGASVWVRLLLVPGAAALWPVMLPRFVRGPSATEGHA